VKRNNVDIFGAKLPPHFSRLFLPFGRSTVPPMTRPLIRSIGNVRGISPALWNSHFLRACRGEPSERTPVWLMRQAGRYMQHYRGIRSGRSFLDLCKDPALATEVTLFAREWLDVDAAIIFSDILVVLEALGLPLTFAAGDGPVLGKPIRDAAAIDALGDPVAAANNLGYVYEAIRRTAAGLPAHIPLIGFCGAPYTLAAYAIEGGSSRQFTHTKQLMYNDAGAWHALQQKLVASLIPYLNAQINAGATCVQIFDSWVGHLTRADYREFVAPHLAALVAGITPGIPVILFGTETGHLSDLIAACGADVIGVDTMTDLSAAWERCGGPKTISVQGNLDPSLLLGPRQRLLDKAADVLQAVNKRPGHIFNLGHGVLKETDPEQAKALVAFVHDQTQK
jgi:uroporphyrinogen decarboxylase